MLVVDGQEGLQAGDREILMWLRQRHPTKKVVLAVNKCENANKADLMASEFWELGIEPLPVSAISGTGTGDMLDALMRTLPPPRSLEQVEGDSAPLAIAIVGRPNVGEGSVFHRRQAFSGKFIFPSDRTSPSLIWSLFSSGAC